MRQGAIDNQPKTPFILGFECAGEVEAIGENVEGVAVGDRVAALSDSRAWAELVAVPAKHVYKLPKNLDFKDAVAITMNFVVAHALLFDVGNLRSGQTLLIHSVGGGVVSELQMQSVNSTSNELVTALCCRAKLWFN